MEKEPDFLTRPDGLKLAVRHQTGGGPTLVFLPGYASDMLGGKAVAVAQWAIANDRAILRLDYAGCGESEGNFADGTLASWRDDALLAIDALASGPFIVIGSSMGGWLALLIALARPNRIAGVIGIAAAPDFTDWGYSDADKVVIANNGRLERFSDYGPEPMITTRAFWQSGQSHLVLASEIDITCPVRLIQGKRDPDVPWRTALRISEQLRSDAVQVHLIKDGDHRLSRDRDIALLLRVTEDLLESL